MSETKIRLAHENECQHLTQLVFNSKRSLGYDDAFMAQCVDELTITPDTLKKADHWVLEQDGVALGIAALYATDLTETGEIKTFFIADTHRGKGVGHLLWKHILDEARRAGITKLHLTSEPLSTGFYTKIGFAIIGEEPSGSIPGRFLPLMELNLMDCAP